MDSSWEHGIARSTFGAAHRTVRLAALGDSLVPQIAQWLGERIVTHELENPGHSGMSMVMPATDGVGFPVTATERLD